MKTVFEIFILFRETFRRAFVVPWRREEIFTQIVRIGMDSLPIILISTAFTGLVVTYEIAWHMNAALHTINMIPGFTAQFVVRELGVAIPALLVVANVGASTTAQLGSMKVTEQIDALKLLGIDPIRYLVFPRFIAGIISMMCLTLIAVFVTQTCAMTVGVLRYHFSFQEYLNTLQHFIGIKDLFCALVKGAVYGGVIPVISCSYGLRCQGGAEGVGSATTNAVVTSTLAIILLDFLLTYFSTWIL
jgi:phospholipid/cholesterol/gamma-HCH transport system permease protein